MQLGYTSLWVFYVSTWLQIHRVLSPSNCCLMVVDRLLRSWTDAKKSFLTQKHLTHLIAAYSCKGFTTKVSVYHHQHGKCDLPLAPSISCHLRALGPFPHTPGTQISPLSSCAFFSHKLSLFPHLPLRNVGRVSTKTLQKYQCLECVFACQYTRNEVGQETLVKRAWYASYE